MSSRTILVTGISGFVGSHVAHQLLEAGYTVRGTAREGKVKELRATAGAAYPNLEVVELNDVASGDLSAAFRDVNALIHIASPLSGSDVPEAIIKSAIDGTLNVMRQAWEAGVYKIVLTSSWGTVCDHTHADLYTGITWTEKDWSKLTREEALKPGQPTLVPYLASKILAERAAWDFAAEHPEIDLATILPPFIYGPLAQHFPFRGASAGTNRWINQLITGPAGRFPIPQFNAPLFCDVRDVAKAHIAALSVPKLSAGKDLEDKRFLISGGSFTWAQAAEHLRTARPSLKSRLPVPAKGSEEQKGRLSIVDTSRAKEILGLDNYIDWKTTVEDTVDALLAEEVYNA